MQQHEDTCQTAAAMAREIGVEVEIFGELPDALRLRLLLGQAIRESAANTVKHAGGSRLFLSSRKEADLWQVELRNNGRPPKGELLESGGLLSLRRMTETTGGTMQVQSMPEFRLILTLPAKDKNDFG